MPVKAQKRLLRDVFGVGPIREDAIGGAQDLRLTLADNLVEVALGPHLFFLQDFYVKEYAGNFVIHLNVDDSEAWWRHIEPLKLHETFGVRAPLPPKVMPWGLKVVHLFDPSGVMWMIAPFQ